MVVGLGRDMACSVALGGGGGVLGRVPRHQSPGGLERGAQSPRGLERSVAARLQIPGARRLSALQAARRLRASLLATQQLAVSRDGRKQRVDVRIVVIAMKR